MKNYEMTREDILKRDDRFRYNLLSRMQSDCEYYLGNGSRHSKHLWAENEKDHIEFMKCLYDSFPDDKKPEWISREQIEFYEKAIAGDYFSEKDKILIAAGFSDQVEIKKFGNEYLRRLEHESIPYSLLQIDREQTRICGLIVSAAWFQGTREENDQDMILHNFPLPDAFKKDDVYCFPITGNHASIINEYLNYKKEFEEIKPWIPPEMQKILDKETVVYVEENWKGTTEGFIKTVAELSHFLDADLDKTFELAKNQKTYYVRPNISFDFSICTSMNDLSKYLEDAEAEGVPFAIDRCGPAAVAAVKHYILSPYRDSQVCAFLADTMNINPEKPFREEQYDEELEL